LNIDLTASQVVELVTRGSTAPSFSMRQLHYWTAEGILRSLNPESTRHRRYEPHEVQIARACAILANGGLSVPALKPVSEILRAVLDRESASRPQKDKKVQAARALLSASAQGASRALFMFHLCLVPGASRPVDWDVTDVRELSNRWTAQARPSPYMIILDWAAVNVEGA
jgi:DNA-binding transcriptional MerR regulator